MLHDQLRALAHRLRRRRVVGAASPRSPRMTVMGLRKSWASMPAMVPRAAMRSRGDQLPLVEVVLEGEGGAGGEHGEEARLRGPEGRLAPAGRGAASTSMPTRPLRAMQGNEHAVAACRPASRRSAPSESRKRASGAGAGGLRPQRGAAASHPA